MGERGSDMVNEVEIVFFQKGSVLVEQEERLPGLYYVLDGFLEVSMTTEEDGQQANILGTAATSVSFDTLTGANGKTDDLPTRRPSASARSRSRANIKKKRHRHTLTLVKPGAIAGYLLDSPTQLPELARAYASEQAGHDSGRSSCQQSGASGR